MNNEMDLSIELDLLPEYKRYVDEGCDMSPSCLSCPLESCVYDIPHGKQVELKRRRDDAIVRVYREERPLLREMARMFKVSTRTIQRTLKKREPTYDAKRKGRKGFNDSNT